MIVLFALCALLLDSSAAQYACDGSNVNQLPQLVGAESVGHGFNARTGQNGTGLFGLGQVFQWTYTLGCSWTSSQTGTQYKVPDQLTFTDVPYKATGLAEQLTFYYEQVFHEYQSNFDFTFGLRNNSFKAAVNFSHMLYEANSLLRENVTASGWSSTHVTYYSLDTLPAYVMKKFLSPSFLLSLNLLPPTIANASDSADYQEFIASFGTHTIVYAKYGGSARQMTYLSQAICTEHSVKEVINQMQLMFGYSMFNVSGHYFSNRSAISFKEWFAANAQVQTFFSGGDPALMSNTTLDEWIASIADTPSPIYNITLVPHSAFLDDSPVRQATLQNFIEEYMAS